MSQAASRKQEEEEEERNMNWEKKREKEESLSTTNPRMTRKSETPPNNDGLFVWMKERKNERIMWLHLYKMFVFPSSHSQVKCGGWWWPKKTEKTKTKWFDTCFCWRVFLKRFQ